MDLEIVESWIGEELAGAESYCRAHGRPSVTLSYAQSLDGSLAARGGEPFALSGPQSLAFTHRLRAAHAGILVGIGTVLSDDPRLNVRFAAGPDPQPVVLDSRLRFPLQASLLAGGGRPPWIAAVEGAPADRQAALAAAGARLLLFPPGPGGRVPLPALLHRLAELGLPSLMVEGGAQVIHACLAGRLADRLVLTIAPLFLGGLPAVPAPLPGGLRLLEPGSAPCGQDLIVWGSLVDRSRAGSSG